MCVLTIQHQLFTYLEDYRVSRKLKVGVIGCGYLGQFHVEKYVQNELAILVGVFDRNFERAQAIAEKNKTTAFHDLTELLEQIEAVSIVTPTLSHYEIAKRCLNQSLHLFIEKPITSKIADAKNLIELAREKNKILQVGHSERYNPAYQAAFKYIQTPQYIETIRIAPFLNRATDVDVIHDLMIHDLDIIAQHCHNEIEDITGNSLSVISNELDFVQASIKFNNGMSVHLTASRISPITRREITFYSSSEIVQIDFANVRYYAAPLKLARARQQIDFEQGQLKKKDIIYSELNDFIEAILYDEKVFIDGNDGLVALQLAHQIKQAVK